ncbi:MAG TPA: NAD(P)/FAD-dependent oxidoreductase [Thermomicrobiales bacterium]|nr:NAD(P)/FAD-dependent oxidoreductase [Thermomicrobiales bacterium]
MYDAIVVGSRCAGSPTAMLLARKGYRVLLLDRTSFPSDTLSTHYIHQTGVASLARWGLLDQVAATNCPPVWQQRLDVGPFALTGTPPPADGVAVGYAPRRTVLDKLLVDAADAAGAEVREHFTVDELVTDGERVTGIRGHAAGGTTVTEEAQIVIGADGVHSLLARKVQAPTYQVQPPLTCAYYSYWSDLPVAGVELYPRPDQMIVVGPTNDAQTLVIVYWPVAAFHKVRTDIETHFLGALDGAPELADRVRAGTRAERFRGTADLQGFFRRPYGPGWALVGDAGYHKDPITAQGISDAFRDADLIAAAIDDGFAGRRPLADALADYERRRNAAVMPMYQLTGQFAALQPPTPEMQQLFGALRQNQEQTDRFFGTIAGTVPIPEFFAPENLGQIISGMEPAVA